jgi:hypothetical protein
LKSKKVTKLRSPRFKTKDPKAIHYDRKVRLRGGLVFKCGYALRLHDGRDTDS